jgi:nitrogen fixation NifU-like protein
MSELTAPAKRFGYSEKVIEHFKNPRNIGKIENPDITAKVGSVACGDLIKLYLKIDKEKNTIQEIKFESYGCAANIATSSVMTELVKGKSLDEALKLTFKDISDELGGLPKIKLHCAVLSRQSLDSAIYKYKANQGLVPLDEAFVRKILRGVLDPIEGTDIISANMVEKIVVDNRKITIWLKIPEGSDLAESVSADIKDAFEGLKADMILKFQSA